MHCVAKVPGIRGRQNQSRVLAPVNPEKIRRKIAVCGAMIGQTEGGRNVQRFMIKHGKNDPGGCGLGCVGDSFTGYGVGCREWLWVKTEGVGIGYIVAEKPPEPRRCAWGEKQPQSECGERNRTGLLVIGLGSTNRKASSLVF